MIKSFKKSFTAKNKLIYKITDREKKQYLLINNLNDLINWIKNVMA